MQRPASYRAAISSQVSLLTHARACLAVDPPDRLEARLGYCNSALGLRAGTRDEPTGARRAHRDACLRTAAAFGVGGRRRGAESE